MMHAIGFQHENERSDRDNYVTVQLHQVQGEFQYAFQKEDTFDKNPYDLGSIMHYSLWVRRFLCQNAWKVLGWGIFGRKYAT